MKRSAIGQVLFVIAILFVMSSILFAVKHNSGEADASHEATDESWQPALVSDQREASDVMYKQLGYFRQDEYGKAFDMMEPSRFEGFPRAQVIDYLNEHFPELMHYKKIVIEHADSDDTHSMVRLHLLITGQDNKTVTINYTVSTDGGHYLVGGWRYPMDN